MKKIDIWINYKKKIIIIVCYDECYCGVRYRERSFEEVINFVYGIRKGFRWVGLFWVLKNE